MNFTSKEHRSMYITEGTQMIPKSRGHLEMPWPSPLPTPTSEQDHAVSLMENTNKPEEIWEEKCLQVSVFRPCVQNISNKLWQSPHQIKGLNRVY